MSDYGAIARFRFNVITKCGILSESEDDYLSTCANITSFVFLKKHKCASSSFQSVFKNYQRLTGIETLIPLYGAFGGGYPAKLDMRFFMPPITAKPKAIKCHHRLNLQLEKQLFPDAKFFTSLREPFSMFRSSYQFHYSRFDM